MILLPVDLVKDHIDPFFLTFRKESELLGFMPCSHGDDCISKYYSVETTYGRVVPVFYDPCLKFVTDRTESTAGPVLFFHGCDDGHTGLKVTSKEDALSWIQNCRYADFELLYRAYVNGKEHLEFHN